MLRKSKLSKEEIVRLKTEEKQSLRKIAQQAGISAQAVSSIIKIYNKPKTVIEKKPKPERNTECPHTKKRCYIKWHGQVSLNCYLCNKYQDRINRISNAPLS